MTDNTRTLCIRQIYAVPQLYETTLRCFREFRNFMMCVRRTASAELQHILTSYGTPYEVAEQS